MRVVVLGVGAVTPLALSAKQLWQRLVSGELGLVSTRSLPDYKLAGYDAIPSKVVGKVPEYDASERFGASQLKRLAPFAQYAAMAASEALGDAQLTPDKVDRLRVGVAVGLGIGLLQDAYDNLVGYENKGYRGVSPLFVPKYLANMAGGNISITHGFEGPLHAVSTACATGAHAIGDAYNFITMGYADAMICGGSEALIHPLALLAFARARSVNTRDDIEPEAALRPFDGDRLGFVLAEGAGILVIESEAHARQRGLTDDDFYGEIVGYGLLGDAHHITAPKEDGSGAFRAMLMALDRAGLSPHQVDYVNAHATLTVIGDRAENHALYRLFGDHRKLFVGSNKAAMGHLLGAAGAVELLFTVMALKHQTVPPTINCAAPGTHSGDDKLQFVFEYPTTAVEADITTALCNSFGFGGVNACLAFKKWHK